MLIVGKTDSERVAKTYLVKKNYSKKNCTQGGTCKIPVQSTFLAERPLVGGNTRAYPSNGSTFIGKERGEKKSRSGGRGYW